jgi:hypothetical protein
MNGAHAQHSREEAVGLQVQSQPDLHSKTLSQKRERQRQRHRKKRGRREGGGGGKGEEVNLIDIACPNTHPTEVPHPPSLVPGGPLV